MLKGIESKQKDDMHDRGGGNKKEKERKGVYSDPKVSRAFEALSASETFFSKVPGN